MTIGYPKPSGHPGVKPRGYNKEALRTWVRDRDGNVCTHCGARPSNEVAHIKSLGSGGKWHPDNMVILCRTCHQVLHNERMSEADVQVLKEYAALATERFLRQKKGSWDGAEVLSPG